MAEYSDEEKVVSVNIPSASSQRSENKGSDYVLLSSDKSLVYSSTESSGDIPGQDVDRKKESDVDEIGEKLSYSDQKSNKTNESDLSTSQDFSLLSQDFSSKCKADKNTEQYSAVSPESFVVLDKSSSEESGKSVSSSCLSRIKPKLAHEYDVLDLESPDGTSSSKVGSVVSSDSIVVLNSTDLSDSCNSTNVSVETPDIKTPSSEIDGHLDNFSTLEKDFECNHEKTGISESLTDTEEDISFITDGALDSLLAEQYKPEKTSADVQDRKKIIESINADQLMGEMSEVKGSKANVYSLQGNDKVSEDMCSEEMEIQLQKLPDVDTNEPTYSLDVDSHSPIAVFQPTNTSQDIISKKIPVQQMQSRGTFQNSTNLYQSDPDSYTHADFPLYDSGEEWPENSREEWPEDFEIHEKESFLNKFPSKSPSFEGSVHMNAGQSISDFSMLESDVVIPGHTDSMVVHLSESSTTPSPEFYLSQDKNFNSRHQSEEFKAGKYCTKYTLEDGNLKKKQKSSISLSPHSCFDATAQTQQQKNMLHTKLVQTFNQFQKQNYNLQNGSDVDKMISEILSIVWDPFEQKHANSTQMESEPSYQFVVKADANDEESVIQMVKKIVPLSEMQIRILKMLVGKSVFEEKYGVEMKIDPKSVEILGIDTKVVGAEKALDDNEWMKDYAVRSVHLDLDLIELVQLIETRDFIDEGLRKLFDFSFCWNVLPNRGSILVYAKSQECILKIESAIKEVLTCHLNVNKPLLRTTAEDYEWEQTLQELCQKYPGKIVFKVHSLFYRVFCTKDTYPVLESTAKDLEKKHERMASPSAATLQRFRDWEQSIKQMISERDKAKPVKMEREVFRYLHKWKMVEIQEVAVNKNVELSEISDGESGFLLHGKADDIEFVKRYIIQCTENVQWKERVIKSKEAIHHLKQDNYKVLKELEDVHRSCIDVQQPGSVPLMKFKIGGIMIWVVRGEKFTTKSNVIVEATDALENTPLGPNRWMYNEEKKRRIVKLVTPVWNVDAEKLKSTFCDSLLEMFEELNQSKVSSATFSVQEFNEWPSCEMVKAVIQSLNTLATRRQEMVLKRVVLCDTDNKVCLQMTNILREALGEPVLREEIVLSPGKKKTKINVVVEKGEIATQKVDVIVNTISLDMDLQKGEVSRSIFDRAGPGIQTQAKQFRPRGQRPGEFNVTSAFSLNCKRVFHASLSPWPDPHSPRREQEKCIETLDRVLGEMLKCASLQFKYESMAIPALGTGNLQIPPKMVIRRMMEVIKRFEKEDPLTPLETIKIIIYPKDVNLYRIFKEVVTEYENKDKEEQLKNSDLKESGSLPPLKSEISVRIDQIQFSAGLGDPTKQEGFDAIVMLWKDDAMFLQAQMSDNLCTSTAVHSCKVNRRDFKLSERQLLVTPAGDLPQKKILHVYVSSAELSDAFLYALFLAEKEGDISSVFFPLRVTDVLAKDYKFFTRSLYRAVEKFTQDHVVSMDISKVRICISGQHMVNPVLSLIEELDAERKSNESVETQEEIVPLIIRVAAMKEEISNLLSKIEIASLTSDGSPYSDVSHSEAEEHTNNFTVFIPEIHSNIYEAFLFFHHDYLMRDMEDIQMSYQKSQERVCISGPRDIVKKRAEFIQTVLQKIKRDMCVDIFDFPVTSASRKASALQIVAEMQKKLPNVLLYVSDEGADSFQIIGLDYNRVNTARYKITNHIGLVSTRSGRSFNQIEGCDTGTRALEPIPIDARENMPSFIMYYGYQVFVYQESILHLPVDCIVNAANEGLDHGGGIAKVISDAAGQEFLKECKQYIQQNGALDVGTCCHTSSGNLRYKYVIHTVGPRWNSAKREDCKRLLTDAVIACICRAAELGMKSVGIPAISSGIFGVPIEDCVHIYGTATLQACLKLGPKSSLKEIHFIDIDMSMVAYMTSAFAELSKDIDPSLPPTIVNPVNPTTATVTSMVIPSAKEEVDLTVTVEYPRINRYHNNQLEVYEFELKKHFKVLVYKGYIVDCKVHAIGFGQDIHLNHGGHIANEVKKRGGKEYQKNLKKAKGETKMLSYEEILVVDAEEKLDSCFFYLEAITPSFSQVPQELSEVECITRIGNCTINLLHKAAEIGVYSLAIPLLGTGSDLEKTSVISGVFFEKVTTFFRDLSPSCSLKELHIVNKHTGPTLAVRDLFEEYVKTQQQKLKQNWPGAYGTTPQKNADQSDNIPTLTNSISVVNSGMLQNNELNTERTLVVDSDVNGKADVYDIGMQMEDHQSRTEESMEIDEGNGNSKATREVPCGQDRNDVLGKENCPICLEDLNENHIVLEKCNHVFCTECIDQYFQYKPVCPACGTAYGIINGNQPLGEMSVLYMKDLHLAGYETYGTYTITYDFLDGVQDENHPNPGVPYEGTSRIAYIPGCPKGKKVLHLLQIAFDRKLVFTIGHSRTTGQDNVVTWNDIHHKTSPHGGPQGFGYPDPQYLDRVLEELAAKGVTENDLPSQSEG